MQKAKKAIVFGIAILAGLAAGPAAAECTLTLGWTSYAPYSSTVAGNADPVGLDIDMARAVVEGAGCQLKFIERPWVAILKGVEEGSIDFATGASRLPEREAFAYYPSSYRQERIGLVVKAGEAAKNPLSDIGDIVKTGQQIGVTKGAYYGARFAELQNDPAFAKLLDPVTDDAHSLKKVIAGRLFGFLLDPIAVPPLLKAQGQEGQVELHPLMVQSDPVHMIFSKKSVSPEVFQKIEAVTKDLKASGKLDAIAAKYSLTP